MSWPRISRIRWLIWCSGRWTAILIRVGMWGVVVTPDVEAAVRADERRRMDSAILWETSCLGCADRYDALIGERAAGAVEAAAAILAGVRELEATLGPKAVRVVGELAAQWGAQPAESHAERPEPLAAPPGQAEDPWACLDEPPC